MAKQDDWVRLTVRMPPDLYGRLNAAVSDGPNSMNAEIVARLESTFVADRAGVAGTSLATPLIAGQMARAIAYETAQKLAEIIADPASEEAKAALSESQRTILMRRLSEIGFDQSRDQTEIFSPPRMPQARELPPPTDTEKRIQEVAERLRAEAQAREAFSAQDRDRLMTQFVEAVHEIIVGADNSQPNKRTAGKKAG